MLPSEKDSPESLRAKMNDEPSSVSVPIPSTEGKFGKMAVSNESNPFGFAESDETHFWYVARFASADKNIFPCRAPSTNVLRF